MKMALVAIALVLSGCAGKTRIEYRVVDLPEPPVLTSCTSTVSSMSDSASDGAVIQGLFSDYIKCKAKNEEALKALDAYRKDSRTAK